jgi:hypothetical protein
MGDVTHDNFVGIYDGFFSSKFCDDLIGHFERCKKNNRQYGRPEQESLKSDQSVNLNVGSVDELEFHTETIAGYMGEFNRVFWDNCYADYIKQYSVLANYQRHSIITYKIQRTDPSGGYHIWHCEDGETSGMRRIGTYILYLNDVTDGGETEFLYLSKRISPKKGRLIIFPPNYPWAHRGNPPLTETKYILTGWTEFT